MGIFKEMSPSTVDAGRGGFDSIFTWKNPVFTQQAAVHGYDDAEKDYWLIEGRLPGEGMATDHQMKVAADMLEARMRGTWHPMLCFDGTPLYANIFTGGKKPATVTLRSPVRTGEYSVLRNEKPRYHSKASVYTKESVNELLQWGNEKRLLWAENVGSMPYGTMLAKTDEELTRCMHSDLVEINELLKSGGHSGTGFSVQFLQPVENVHSVKGPAGHLYMVKHHGQAANAQSLTQALSGMRLTKPTEVTVAF